MGQGLGLLETMSGKGHGPQEDGGRTGFAKYFNNETVRGRANVSKATLSFVFVAFVYYKFIHNARTPIEKKPN